MERSEDDGALAFEHITMAQLTNLSAEALDDLSYGVVGLNPDGRVNIYNRTEARLAGIKPESVVGTHYFSGTAQCMNNFMVAQRFEDEPSLDTIIDYVLTLRMRPTPVRLRLMSEPGMSLSFVLIDRAQPR